MASPAVAAWYIGKPLAESYTRQVLHSYGYTGTATYCRPQQGYNESYNKRGHILFHRWVCGWATGYPGNSCKGIIGIIGSDGRYPFKYYRHFSRGEAC